MTKEEDALSSGGEKESEPTKISENPPTWSHYDSDHSNGAIYTCNDCGAKHKAFKPQECLNCECVELDWSFSYGYRGRFA